MKILILSGYYFPEKTAGTLLTQELVDYFSKNGIKVELFTPVPCRGIDQKTRNDYKRKKIEKHNNGLLIIHRYYLIKEGKNVIVRAMRYILQNVIQIVKGISCKCDVILLASTPPTMGLVGAILKKVKKVPFVYNIQDMFPDSLVSTGITKQNSIIYKIAYNVANIGYKNSDALIAISEDMKKNLLSKGIPKNKIYVCNNWIDVNRISNIKRSENSLFDELKINRSNFIVLYAGNMGNAQDIDIILNAANLLKSYANIQFVLFGGGDKFSYYTKVIEEYSNVVIFPLQPAERISEVYSIGNCAIVSCKKGTGQSAMPSKTWSIMATSTPLIVSYDRNTDIERVIELSGAGLFSTAGDLDSFCANILKMYDNSILCEKMSVKGTKYVEKYASIEVGPKTYKHIIERVLSKNGNTKASTCNFK